MPTTTRPVGLRERRAAALRAIAESAAVIAADPNPTLTASGGVVVATAAYQRLCAAVAAYQRLAAAPKGTDDDR